MGLDWDAIRAEYEQKASPEELAPVDPSVTPRQRAERARYQRGPRSGHEYGDGTASTVPRHLIIEMYNNDNSVAKIAAHFGVHVSAIYKHLHAAAERGQVTLRDDRRKLSGMPKRTVCGTGEHSMEDGDPNVRVDKNGARHCRACDKRRRSKSRAEE